MKKRSLVHGLWLGVAIYAIFIFYLSSLSEVPGAPRNIPFADKLFHVVLYSVFGVLLYLAMTHTWNRMPTSHIIMFVMGATVFYGITDEMHQVFVAMREPSVWDVVADGIGGLLGGLAVHIWRIKHDR